MISTSQPESAPSYLGDFLKGFMDTALPSTHTTQPEQERATHQNQATTVQPLPLPVKVETSSPAFVPSAEPGHDFGKTDPAGSFNSHALVERVKELTDNIEELILTLKETKKTTTIQPGGHHGESTTIGMTPSQFGRAPISNIKPRGVPPAYTQNMSPWHSALMAGT